jgi:Trk-type K+ transport system membrane component
MTPEEKSLLERTYKMAEENNTMLRSIRRSNRVSLGFRIAYWIIILIIAFGSFYFIQPYVNTLLSISGQGTGLQGISNSINNAQSAANGMKDLFK